MELRVALRHTFHLFVFGVLYFYYWDPAWDYKAATRIDSHVFTWAGPDLQGFPYDSHAKVESKGPSFVPTFESLLTDLDSQDIDGALIVQPARYGFDHSYLQNAVSRSKGRLKAMCLVHPQHDNLDMAAASVTSLAKGRYGCAAFRFMSKYWPAGHRMDDETGSKYFALASELDVPIDVIATSEMDVTSVRELSEASPSTKVILNHASIYPHTPLTTKRLITLVKESSSPRSFYIRIGSSITDADLLALIGALGADHLMWGSNYPFTDDQLEVFVEQCKKIRGVTTNDINMIIGGSAHELFGKWQRKK